jgi:hypothetical protein
MPMDQPVDEHTRSDLESIADKRQLSDSQGKMLKRNVTGTLRPNRDYYLWVLVNVLSALLLCRSRQSGAFNPVVCAQNVVLEGGEALEKYCDGQDGVRLSNDGIAVDAGGLKYEAVWVKVDHALAFGAFFIEGNEGALYGSFVEAVMALHEARGAAAGLDVAVGVLSRRIGQWRRDHLPLGKHERIFSSLLAFLSSRQLAAQRRGMAFDDDDIVAYWRHCVEDGDRLMFRTAVERFRVFERVQARQATIRNLGAPADLDALVTRTDLDVESGEGWNDTEDELAEGRLVDALKSLSTDPKALKGTEADAIKALITLRPFQKTRPLTVLRVLAFDPVQSGIANYLRRGGGGDDIEARVTCATARSYDEVASYFESLLAHLDRLLRIAAALRFGGNETQRIEDPQLAEMILRRAQIIQQGNVELKRMRRYGFDRPREELAAIFAQFDEMLSRLRDEMSDFIKELKRLGGREALGNRFVKDRAVFTEILTRAYIIVKQESEV